MAGAVRFTTAELIETESRIVACRRARARHRAGGVRRACRGDRRARSRRWASWPPRWPSSTARRGSPSWRRERGLRRGPLLDDSHDLRDPRRAPSRGRAGAGGRQGRRLHRQRLRAGRGARRRADRLRRGDARRASGSSPAPTWRASRRSCARTRSSPCWRRWARSCRRAPPTSASSTGCSPASAPPTISRAGARPSWSRWWRRPPSSTRRRDRSLVILDEIGRGTATFDGLSIAWAVVEYLHEVTGAARCSPPTTTS